MQWNLPKIINCYICLKRESVGLYHGGETGVGLEYYACEVLLIISHAQQNLILIFLQLITGSFENLFIFNFNAIKKLGILGKISKNIYCTTYIYIGF